MNPPSRISGLPLPAAAAFARAGSGGEPRTGAVLYALAAAADDGE